MVQGIQWLPGRQGRIVVSQPDRQQWSPAVWPVSLRWRLLAAFLVLAFTAIAIIALSRNDDLPPEVPVVAAAQWWPEGHTAGDHLLISVPADLAPLFVASEDLEGKVASVDVPEGTLVSPQMLRARQGTDGARTTALLRFSVNADLWPAPGPAPGDRAVFSSIPGGCATAEKILAAVELEGATPRVTVEADPELAVALADTEWSIWESPPGGWPSCEHSGDDDAVVSALRWEARG